MGKKTICLVFMVLLAGPVLTFARGPKPVGWWTLDGDAEDMSGNANHGVLMGNPSFGQGMIGPALDLNGSSQNVEVPDSPSLHDFTNRLTVTAWINPLDLGNSSYYRTIVAKFGPSDRKDLYLYLNVNLGAALAGPQSNDWTPNIPIDIGAWTHVALTYDGSAMVLYKNGVALATQGVTGNLTLADASSNGPLFIGYNTSWIEYFHGLMDDVRLYNTALTAEEILAAMEGEALERAADPSPADEENDVPRDVVLSWTPGDFAAAHDVYLGTGFDDVNDASTTDPKGALVRHGQADTTYDPEGVLEYGQTYYWRIDEVNAAPDSTIFKGDVWSFTVEPFAYPITGITATASSAQPGMGPENIINGRGLNANGEHSTELTDMWMTTGALPNWIQYEFDKVYKLDSLLVWNSNQLIEAFIGFGAKDVTIEYSVDGQTWTTLEGAPQFAQATGSPTYTANTTVDFGGAMAKFVKLTINQTWGGVAPQTGLAEVRFLYVPVQAFQPAPALAATDVSIDTDLTWRPGREAESHEVYLGTDAAALALVDTVTEHSAAPASLDFATNYFWRVDEVGGEGPYEGDVWSFTTEEYATVDDFESYNDDDNRIYDSWIDGLTTGASGSQVGYDVSPFAEKTIVHGGLAAMPLIYDNSASPFISEAERTFASPQNWTVSGADSLSLYVRGSMPAFVETATGSVLMNAIGTDIWDIADQFRLAYKTLNGNGTMVARVDSIANSNAWAKGGVMIRQSIEPGSVHAFMAITPGGSGAGNGASFQHRVTANAASTNNDNTGAVVAAPYWVKIERNGNTFTGAISPDGKTWTPLGAPGQTITMTGPVLIGLALCSHDANISTGAEFSNIAMTGNVTGNWQVAEISAVQPAGNSVEGMYVTIKDSSGKSATVANPDTAATVRGTWQQWRIPLSDFAGVKMNAVKSIVIGVGNKTASVKGGTGTLFVDDLGFGRSVAGQ